MSGPLYPVTLDVAGRRCLVVGGGRVAARKVNGLLTCGAVVTVVAPEVIAELAEREANAGPGSLTISCRPYEAGEVRHYRLVLTATGIPAVDQAVARDCEAAGIWVNSADDPAHSSFVLPSVHRADPLTVAVSTSGTSPALAIWLRRRLGDQVGDHLPVAAALVDEARRSLRDDGRSTESIDWQSFFDGPFLSLVHAGRLDDARALLAELVGGHPQG